VVERERGATRRIEILADVLCGVDGTRSAYEAVRQAAALTGPDGHLMLLAVTVVRGSGEFETALLAPAQARRALDHARRLAREAGVSSSRELDPGGPAVEVVLTRARRHALLALGALSMSRLAHICVGGVATAAAHALPSSLLIARRPPAGRRFGDRIMIASDALKHSDGLVDFAVELARERQASLVLFHAARAQSVSHPTRITAQADLIRRALGDRSTLRVDSGRAHRAIVQAAAQEGVSLVVLSSRRLHGARALGSVSERVVHGASCSVLVVRPEDLRR
jgi:nucleotide-binding universal stress UspA family protein